MAVQTFEVFKQEAVAAGFEEVLERQWPADQFLDTHTHPFAVRAQVIQGDMWLGLGGNTSHLVAGSTFEVGRDVPHSERYGPQGATYWVARKYL